MKGMYEFFRQNLLLEKARSLLLDAVGCMSCPIAPQLSENWKSGSRSFRAGGDRKAAGA